MMQQVGLDLYVAITKSSNYNEAIKILGSNIVNFAIKPLYSKTTHQRPLVYLHLITATSVE